jgi:hypothetical protein
MAGGSAPCPEPQGLKRVDVSLQHASLRVASDTWKSSSPCVAASLSTIFAFDDRDLQITDFRQSNIFFCGGSRDF